MLVDVSPCCRTLFQQPCQLRPLPLLLLQSKVFYAFVLLQWLAFIQSIWFQIWLYLQFYILEFSQLPSRLALSTDT